jgi:uncharacterized protein
MLNIARAGTWQGVLHSPAAWVFVLVLVVVFPIVDYVLYFRLKSTLELYTWNILAEWSLVAGCMCVARANGVRFVDLGEWMGNPLRTLVVSGLLLAILAVLIIASKSQQRKASADQLSKAIDQARRLLPVNPGQRVVWVAVAVTAGVCEEFLYRGWLLNLIAAASGSMWLGLVASSIIFGTAHVYQGRKGVMGAGVLGIVLGAVCVLSGTLVPAQILHAVIDLNNGLALGKIVERLGNPPAS